MKFFAKPSDAIKTDADLLVVFATVSKKTDAKYWDNVLLLEDARTCDKALDGLLTESGEAERFDGSCGSTVVVPTQRKIAARSVLLVGLGALDKLAMSDVQTMSATIGRLAKKIGAARVALSLSSDILDVFGTEKTTQGIVEGMVLGTYVFLKHKNEDAQKSDRPIAEVYFLSTPGRLNAVTSGITLGETTSTAVVFARNLINEPPAITTPTHLGDVAKAIVKGKSMMSAEVFGKADMEKMGMGGILGIAQGSDEEPKFIRLDYKGGGRKTIVLVGKGITFDSGGLSIKPASGMETMKLDMSGAAAVLAVFSVLAILAPKVTVVGLISATENMLGPKAIKPGDIVRAMNGKTIEILNTDAEGRVVLSDALSYAVAKIKPDAIVDLATLTGACMVALGEDITGLFANNDALANTLKTAAEKTGEKVWELPLVKEYKDRLKSSIADIKNISGSRYGGAINGALFLQEFVPDSVAWAHLDIAGPSFAEKDSPLTPLGGTGFGVRMLLEYLLNS